MVPDAGGGGLHETGAPEAASSSFGYPSTRTVDAKDVLHGVQVPDPYRWLEDVKSAEVQAWMQVQDKFARSWLDRLPERDAIAARLRELYYVESMGTPHRYGKRYFYSRREAKREKSAVFWRQGASGAEQVLLDPNTWSDDGTVSLGAWSVSWDGARIAYAVKANNSDEAVLHVMDVATGKKSDTDVIPGAKYAHPSWTPKGDGFYYVWLPPADAAVPVPERPGFAELRFHKLGEDPAKDEVVYPATKDPRKFLGGQVSRDGRWLLASVYHGWSRADVYFQDLSRPAPRTWTPLITGRDAMYEVAVHKGKFYILTNEEAPNGRIFAVDPASPQRDKWKEIVAEQADSALQSHAIVGGRLALEYLKDVTTRLEVRDLNGKLERQVALPGVGTASNIEGDPELDEAYYWFTSFTQPTEIHKTSVKSGKDELWYRLKVPVDASKYVVEQQFAASKDGTKVPMFIVRAKDMARDGKAPALLFGYGGFQVSLTPGFSTNIFPWLERGGVYIYANLRGGSEYGEKWHRAGMKHVKQNTFDDFIAVAEYLVRERYTSTDRLVIRGGSNGGLLMGAAMTQRPDLFRVVLCGVPLLDMIRYHLYGSGKTWIEEYGSADDAEDFKTLYAYSPYHHVKPGTRYPSLLMLSADNDDRVDPMHARKFAALMQASSQGGPVLLRIEQHAGHGGADLIKASVEKGADEYAFALSQISREPRP
ncbi:MAG: S9 family peptidase [Deltaproteobacteria bacterium]|nr:S9 family peptidase [Deltaproteobacteria bacterium]